MAPQVSRASSAYLYSKIQIKGGSASRYYKGFLVLSRAGSPSSLAQALMRWSRELMEVCPALF